MALYNNFQSDYKKKLDAYNALYPSTKGVSAEKLLPIVVSTKAAYDAASKAYAEAKNTYDNGASKALEEAISLYENAQGLYTSTYQGDTRSSLTIGQEYESLKVIHDTSMAVNEGKKKALDEILEEQRKYEISAQSIQLQLSEIAILINTINQKLDALNSETILMEDKQCPVTEE